MMLVDRFGSPPDPSCDFTRLTRLVPGCILVAVLLVPATANAGTLPEVGSVERQPLVAATKRLVEALEYAGSPLPKADLARLKMAYAEPKEEVAVKRIQAVLDRHCLVGATGSQGPG